MAIFMLASEKGLFEELWEYFEGKYFSVDMPYLENFTVESSALMSLRMIIIGITFGLIFGSIAAVFNKRYLGCFVRSLVDNDCLDRESAKTLQELGYQKDVAVRSVIKSGGTLSRWARCREEDEFFDNLKKMKEEFEAAHANDAKAPKFKEPEFKRDLDTMHFYVLEEKKYEAEVKFDSKGFNWGSVFLVTMASILLCAFACYILPDAIKMVDNFITIMNK